MQDVQDQNHQQLQEEPVNPNPNEQEVIASFQAELDQSGDLYKASRSNFVVKVYSILGIQLSITSFMVLCTSIFQDLAQFQRQNGYIIFISFVAVFGSMIALMCKKKLSQTFPINMILLAVFTIGESYIVSSISAQYEPKSVLIASVATAATTLGLTMYAVISNSDLSTWTQKIYGLGSAFLATFAFSMIITFWLNIPFLSMALALGFGLLYCIYLIHDTQMILNNIKHNISLDQYVLASLFLYIDIVGLFLQILRIFGNRRTN